MSQNFKPGDFLIFQVESGYGLLKLIEISGSDDDPIWHLRAFNELFLDVEGAENALSSPHSLSVSIGHVALTNRAFLATQVAIMKSGPLADEEISSLVEWKKSGENVIDSPIRLLLGLR